jgi:hypothetical protein
MFEMTYRNVDGQLVRGGMCFDGHSPGVFVTRNSSMISRKDWPKMKYALDALPGTMAAPQLSREDELTLKHEKEMRDAFNELEEGFGASHLDAHPTIRAFVTSVRNKYCSHHHSIRGKPSGARDEDPDTVLGGALSGRSRDVGESVFQKHGVTHHSHHGAIDAAREAASRIGFVSGPAPAGRRLTKQERKQIAFDAQAAASGFCSMAKQFGQEFANNVARCGGKLGRV